VVEEVGGKLSPFTKSLFQPERPRFISSCTSTTSISFNMPESDKAFYVTSVSNGHVLANQANSRPSGVVASNRGDKGNDEKWIIEAGDKPNVVALRNASNGKYLRAEGGKNSSKAGTGEKQWWTISSDRVLAPGACSLSPVDYPNVYLNHFQGRAVPKGHAGMTVHMWQWEVRKSGRLYIINWLIFMLQASYPQWFSWYMFDTDANFNPLTSSGDTGNTETANFDSELKALEERNNALAEKEQVRSKEWDDKMKDLQDRESALKDEEQTRSKDWDDKMKDLQDRDSKSVKDEEKRTADFDQKLKALQDREAALSRQEDEANSSGGKTNKHDMSSESEEQSQKEADIQRKLDDLKSAEQRLAADRAELQKAQNDLARREKDITQRQKDTSKAPDYSTNGHATQEKTAEQRLERTQKDNAGLEQRLAKLEDQLAKMARSPEKAPEGKAQANGKTDASKSGKIDANSPGCGYKHYKPPRKLNRKLIGMVYE